MGNPYIRQVNAITAPAFAPPRVYVDDFEATLLKWNTILAGGASVARITTMALSGTAAMRLTLPGAAAGPESAIAYIDLPIPRSKIVTIAGAFRVSQTGNAGNILFGLNWSLNDFTTKIGGAGMDLFDLSLTKPTTYTTATDLATESLAPEDTTWFAILATIDRNANTITDASVNGLELPGLPIALTANGAGSPPAARLFVSLYGDGTIAQTLTVDDITVNEA